MMTLMCAGTDRGVLIAIMSDDLLHFMSLFRRLQL